MRKNRKRTQHIVKCFLVSAVGSLVLGYALANKNTLTPSTHLLLTFTGLSGITTGIISRLLKSNQAHYCLNVFNNLYTKDFEFVHREDKSKAPLLRSLDTLDIEDFYGVDLDTLQITSESSQGDISFQDPLTDAYIIIEALDIKKDDKIFKFNNPFSVQ